MIGTKKALEWRKKLNNLDISIEQMQIDIKRIEALLEVRERAADPGFKMMWGRKLKELMKNITDPRRNTDVIT